MVTKRERKDGELWGDGDVPLWTRDRIYRAVTVPRIP